MQVNYLIMLIFHTFLYFKMLARLWHLKGAGSFVLEVGSKTGGGNVGKAPPPPSKLILFKFVLCEVGDSTRPPDTSHRKDHLLGAWCNSVLVTSNTTEQKA